MRAENRAGFTLVEVMVALAIIGIIAALGLFATVDSYQRAQARTGAGALDLLLRRARAEAFDGDASAGVCYEPTARELRVLDTRGGAAMPLNADAAVTGLPDCSNGSFSFAGAADIMLTEAGQAGRITINASGGIDDEP